jgi:uncharacterized protein (DUF1778 family)
MSELDQKAVEAACEAAAITIARQDGVELTPAGYRHGVESRRGDHAQLHEWMSAAIHAYLSALPSAPAVEDGATKGDIDRWRAAIPAAAKAMASHLDVASSIASSSPVEGVEPVAWSSVEQFEQLKKAGIALITAQRHDVVNLSDPFDMPFNEPLYPASAISRLQRLVDGIDDERRGALDLCIERNKQIQALEKDVVRLTALLAEADEVNRALLDWAEARCPCHDEKPDPCPLCGASAKPGGGHCMSAENTLPRHLLEMLRSAHRRYQREGK